MKTSIMILIAIISLLILGGCSEEAVKEGSEIPKICTADWNPVCGVDDTTYANECNAGDIEIAYSGECKETHTCTAEEKENQIYHDIL